MSLSGVAVRRPVGTVMVFIAVIVFGAVALSRLSVDLMPQVDFPEISVTTRYEGMAPEDVETLITRPVEQALSTIAGVRKLTSESAEGQSNVEIEFDWGASLDEAMNDVRTAIDRIRARLPEDVEPPVIFKFDLSSMPVAYLGISGGGDVRKLRYLADDLIARRLERVSGVAAVQVRGGRVREFQVRLDSARLVALGVTTSQVSDALARENRNVSAGDMLEKGKEVVIRTVGEFEDTDDIADTVITSRGGKAIHVRDVAEVFDSFAEVQSEVWLNGKAGIRIAVFKESGVNTIAVARGLRSEIDRINEDYGGRLRISWIIDSSEFISNAVGNVQSAAIWGGLLAVIVLLLILRNARATIVIATSIPVSILATFGLMYFADMSLNLVSLGGLTLGVGMLVDNAVVNLENIFRKREQGKEKLSAAIEGSGEVAGAVTASTLTTLVVFVPVVFVGGVVGILFKEMAVVVSFALACSLFVALTLVPSMSARILKLRDKDRARGFADRIFAVTERWFVNLETGYDYIVRRVIRRPALVIAIAVLAIAGSMTLAPLVGVELMPETDEGRLDVEVELPVGTPLETTMATMQELEQKVRQVILPEEIRNLMTVAGQPNPWHVGGTHQGSMRIMLVPVSERERYIDVIERAVGKALAAVPGVDVQIRRGSSNILMRVMRGGGDRLVVDIIGHDPVVADSLARKVKAIVQSVPGVIFARSDREEGMTERVLAVDRGRLAELGLSGADVAAAVETYVLGTISTRIREQGNEYDVRVQLKEADRAHLDQLASLPILAPGGQMAPLNSVARIEKRAGFSSIVRENEERIIHVNAGISGRALGDIAADLEQKLDSLTVPDGFTVSMGGELREQAEAFVNLLVGILLAVFLVYAVMAVQFESVREPLVVMTAVPFASIGVIFTLAATGTTFNMNSFFGTIVLVGIVVNNAIVLVDYINMLRRSYGLELMDALITGARRRLRPIMVTTLTTACGMLPMALGMGEGGEIQAPLARVVIGGLLSSSLVTLIFVPCLYFLVERRRI
jgi:HAE1 family hydrophobic/amphiphilic exporter-1